MSKPADNNPAQQPRMRGIPRDSADAAPLAWKDETIGAPQYLAINTDDGWQLLLEDSHRYLRWVLRGPIAHGGQAWPDTDVARSSLEREGGSLHGKPALERSGNDIGVYHNLRTRPDGEPMAMSECLEDGLLELEFEGEKLAGRWRLSRSGMSRREQETWTLVGPR